VKNKGISRPEIEAAAEKLLKLAGSRSELLGADVVYSFSESHSLSLLDGSPEENAYGVSGGIALRDMRERLVDDHKNASLLASLLSEIGFDVENVPRRTNMVYFRTGKLVDAASLIARCLNKGLLIGAAGPDRIRMVTHLGIDENSVKQAVAILKEINV
jgi:threonine aldolase